MVKTATIQQSGKKKKKRCDSCPTSDKIIKRDCKLSDGESFKRFSFPGHPGLYLECRMQKNQMVRTWRYQYRRGGKGGVVEVFTIGRYSEVGDKVIVGIEKAKAAYAKAKALVKEGINPTNQRKEEFAARIELERQKLSVIGRKWLEARKKADAASTYSARKFRYYTFIEKKLGNIPLQQVNEKKVKDLIQYIFDLYWKMNSEKETARPSVAPRLALMDINQLFKYASHELEIKVDNPCVSLVGRDGFISSLNKSDKAITEKALKHVNKPALNKIEDIPELANLLRKIYAPIESLQKGEPAKKDNVYVLANIAMIALARIACRPVELMSMRWSQVDIARQTWTAIIPKTKKIAKIALSKSACQLLLLAKKLNNSDDFVFRSLTGEKPIKDDLLYKMLPKLGYAGRHTPHAWRSTFRTLGAELFRFPKDDMELQLTHAAKGDKTELAYNKAELLNYRIAMMDAWSEFIDKLLTPGARINPRDLQKIYSDLRNDRINGEMEREIIV